MKNDHGNIYGALYTSDDITELQTALNKLKSANVELLRSNEQLEQFASIASHDLQEPIRKIHTFSTLLEKRSEGLNSESLTYLYKIKSAASRMSLLINGLLDYSRAVRNNALIKQVDLNEVVGGILVDLELMIAQKNARITVAKLPTINGIPLQLHQLFYNLINNGLKFASNNTPTITISISDLSEEESLSRGLQGGKSYLRIVVADNGIGFDQQYADRIFEMFYRINGAGEYPGTGLGLPLCRRIAENHQGKIFAEAVPSEGARFIVILPRD